MTEWGKKTRKHLDIYRNTTVIGIVHLIVKFTTRVFPLFSHSSFNGHTPLFFFFRISSLLLDKASHLLILVHLINILLEYKKNLGLLY